MHYHFVVWLQCGPLATALVAAIKAAIVFGGTLLLSWIPIVAVGRIPSALR